MDFSRMTIQELIDPKGYDCSCGKHHCLNLKYLSIRSGAIEKLPKALDALGCSNPFVVCDKNTYEAAAKRAGEILSAAGIAHTIYVVPEMEERLRPSEWELGSIAMHFDPRCDVILGVGSGVINDLCKIFGHGIQKPNMIVATAPSMDGYASNSSSMEVNNVKTTIYTQMPSAILCDTDIMAKAPIRMLWAGFGDMMAKFLSVCEWRIANLANGEYYCDAVADIMRSAARKVMDAAAGISARDPAAVQAIAEGLIAAGIAMSYAEMSRPASGQEHYFSHMWEMMALARHKPYDLHGIQVGVSTLLACRIYEKLKGLPVSREKAEESIRAFDREAWAENVRRVFGSTAPEIFAIEEKAGKNDPEKHAVRLARTVENWELIQQTIEKEIPPYEQLYNAMKVTGMPMTPADIGIGAQDVHDAFVCSRDMRDRYLISSMLWDIGELKNFADELFPV